VSGLKGGAEEVGGLHRDDTRVSFRTESLEGMGGSVDHNGERPE